MTRSTELESESVSIAHYELRNARRESLLSQNWIASEEKNTNVLLFDHEMIKISISTELNAWISIHETDDLVVFIKYICQQHDIEIKTHNNMIQMLNDVNKINIELKVINIKLKATQITLNAVRMHLQKEMKKKKRDYTSFKSDIKSIKHFDFERSILEVNQAIWLVSVWRFEAECE